MNRLIWVTDTHLEFASDDGREKFAADIKAQNGDALLMTGDISDAKRIERLLMELQKRIGIPIYFVLGNHDYYYSSIHEVRSWAKGVTKQKSRPLFWMGATGIVRLDDTACMIGVDGWADGRLGDFMHSQVVLNDWDLIEDFNRVQAVWDRSARLKLLNKLADREAEYIRPLLAQALAQYKRVLLLTHVPPWKEATWHDGKHSDDAWVPWFSCKAVGDAIVEEAAKHPGCKVTVLCGHTHGTGHSVIDSQVDVYTGGAKYRYPEIQKIFELKDGDFVKHSAGWYNVGYR